MTRLLSAIEQGDAQAAEQLLPLVYDELRKLATKNLSQGNPGQTLQEERLITCSESVINFGPFLTYLTFHAFLTQSPGDYIRRRLRWATGSFSSAGAKYVHPRRLDSDTALSHASARESPPLRAILRSFAVHDGGSRDAAFELDLVGSQEGGVRDIDRGPFDFDVTLGAAGDNG